MDVNTDETLSKLEAELQTKTAQVEIVGHGLITEKLRTVEQQFPAFKKEDKMIKLEKLFQTLNTTEIGLNITKQQLSEAFQYFASTIKVHETSTGDGVNKQDCKCYSRNC